MWITTNFWKILKEIGVPDNLTYLLRNPYTGQEATVRTRHGITDWFQIVKGVCQGLSDSSVGKESACNAGDPSSIPGSGRSTGEGIGYPNQYSWASLVAQLVKNLPAMWETWV